MTPCPVTFLEGPTRMVPLAVANSPELGQVEVSLPVHSFSPREGIVSRGSLMVVVDAGESALWGADSWDMPGDGPRLVPRRV